MNISELLDKLKERLQTELPGASSHIKMAPPGRFPTTNIPKPNDSTRIGAVLLLLYPMEGGGSILFPLIVRPEYEGVHSGQVAFPGGKQDESDEDLIETALREAYEEIGVKITREHVIGQLSEIYIPPSNFLVFPTIAYLPEKPMMSKDDREVEKIFEVPIDNLQDRSLHQVKKVNFKGMDLDIPYFKLGEYDVWGATAMILAEFLELWEEIL